MTFDEEKELRMRRRTYMQEMPKYNRRAAVMRSLPITIQETISRTYLFCILKRDTAYEMLRALKKRVAPSDRVRLIGLSNQYQKPGRDWKNPYLELASHQWEKTYKEDQKFGLPKVTNAASIEAFGSVDVILDGPNGPRKVELQNTALGVSSPISIISLNRFAAKNVDWNTKYEALIYQGEIFCRFKQRYDQWVLEYNSLIKSVSSAQPTPQAFPEEAAIVELCSEASTEVEPLRGSKTVECKAAAERSEWVITKSHGHESHVHAIQIDGHCPGDMPPKTTETAGLLTADETPIKCRHQELCREISQPVSSSREMIKDIEMQICRQDGETSLEKDSKTRIGEK
ncbi:hypothetical protein MMC29_000514 [Sticta canariensis]|nr:hypothetical protein [Sticta canariensis]